MVGLFSRFSTSRAGHRRTQSALDQREVLAPSLEGTTSSTLATAASTGPHGIEIAVEFKPVEHPTEPLDNDQPIQCPLPEPSILNDGRIWKERVSSGVQRTSDPPVTQDQAPIEAPNPLTKPRSSSKRGSLPSDSASEHIQRTSDPPVIQDQAPTEAPNPVTKPRSSSKRGILPSVSAPEHNFLKLLEESGM